MYGAIARKTHALGDTGTSTMQLLICTFGIIQSDMREELKRKYRREPFLELKDWKSMNDEIQLVG